MDKLFRACCGRDHSPEYEAVETVERDGRAFSGLSFLRDIPVLRGPLYIFDYFSALQFSHFASGNAFFLSVTEI